MTALYVPPTEESDHKKQNMSLQLIGGQTSTNTTNIAANTADIATLVANAATYVVGPGSATANGFAIYSGTTGKLVKDHAATIALASEVSGTLPVANGGTAYTGGAWSSFTPTIAAGTGTFTTASATARQLTIGKLIVFQIAITITTNGTAATFITATLPANAVDNYTVIGKQLSTNKACSGVTAASSNLLTIQYYDGTYPGASGATIALSGMYESA